jgi:hypothetical protein
MSMSALDAVVEERILRCAVLNEVGEVLDGIEVSGADSEPNRYVHLGGDRDDVCVRVKGTFKPQRLRRARIARTGVEIELVPTDSIDADRMDQIVSMTPGNKHEYLLRLLPEDRVNVLVDNVHGARPAYQVNRTIHVTIDGQLEITNC